MTIKRIAVIMPRLPGRGMVGGAETLLTSLAERAAAAGIEVDVLTTCALDHVTWRNELPPGNRRHGKLNVHFYPVDPRGDTVRFDRIQSAISAGTAVDPEAERFWIDHNVNSTPLCEALAASGTRYDRILTGPYLFGLTLQTALLHPDRTLLVPCLHDEPFARLRAFQTLFSRVHGILFNTEPEHRLAQDLYDLSAVKTAVVGMGMAPFPVAPGTFRERHGLQAPYLLYCGRREPLKGTPLLLAYLDTFRQRTGHDIRLVLTGSGVIEPPPGLAPVILDLGFVEEAEKRAAMADCLAFCHPSTNESFGIVLLEAWLAGRPALVHGYSTVLTDHCRRSGGGLWFRFYPDFEEQVNLLLQHPRQADAMGRQGRRYVETHYLQAAVDQRLAAALAQ